MTLSQLEKIAATYDTVMAHAMLKAVAIAKMKRGKSRAIK